MEQRLTRLIGCNWFQSLVFFSLACSLLLHTMYTHIDIFLRTGNMTAALILCLFSCIASGRPSSLQSRLKHSSTSLGVLLCDVEMNLTRSLLNPIVYDKSVRPARDHRDVTNVSFDLSLAQLIDVDEKNQIITTNQWITMVGEILVRSLFHWICPLELVRSQTSLGTIRMGQRQFASYQIWQSLVTWYCSL